MIKFLIVELCFFLLTACYAEDNLSEHLQLIVVTSDSWESRQGTLQLFERVQPDDRWISAGQSFPVVLGKNGMAWGIGLYKFNESSKVEGDLKSPAGIFSLGSAFGFSPKSEMTDLKLDYLEINEFTVAVDDPLSAYYNCIVDSREVIPDWNSSEQMRKISLYELGSIIHHNFPQPQSNKGSAIFFHQWRNENAGTAGCTAMHPEALKKLLFWLDKNKNPLLVQLPYSVYLELQSAWDLPQL